MVSSPPGIEHPFAPYAQIGVIEMVNLFVVKSNQALPVI